MGTLTKHSIGSPLAELVCVDPKEVRRIWPHCSHLIWAALEHCGDWTPEEIEQGLFDGPYLLWITWDGSRIKAACVTRLIVLPRGLVCQAVACGGADECWPSRFEPIEQYAKNEGCIATRIQGRPGWARVFKEYKTEWVCLEKRLD